MATNFPTSLDDGTSLPNPGATNKTNNPSHAAQHDTENDAIKAIEAKVGTGASTPTSNTLLRGNGTGTSTWAQLTSAQLAASISDETGTGLTVFGTTPTIVTPKIDTINESIPGNGTTVGGVNIRSGALNTNNSVVTANITDAAVTPAKLLAGTGSSWSWQSWTPTFTNWAIGTGGSAGTTAKYIQIGKTVFFYIQSVLGTSGQSVGSSAKFTLPVTATSTQVGNTASPIANLMGNCAGVFYSGQVWSDTTTTGLLIFQNASATYLTTVSTSSTIPNTWAAGNYFQASGHYEAA